jgi:hypothetical protein
MSKHIKYKTATGETLVMHGSKLYELLTSGKNEDTKSAKRLHEFCTKAANCAYQQPVLGQLREHYKDVA